MRLTSLLAPALWSYASQTAFLPLATAMHASRPDLIASALQAVGFVTCCTGILAIEAMRARGETREDLTIRDWQQVREQHREREREAQREYEQTIRPGNLALGCANGKGTKVFHFPAGITLEHLTAFGDLVAAGKPPRYRNLKQTFDYQVWSNFRDWLMVAELNKFAVMANYTDGRDGWDVNACGRKLAIIWRCALSPTGLLSSAVKRGITRNRTIYKQLESA